uniref:Uncharacterized protein n=2 Tax=Aegilops tauschii subsp. strangulata TaxID=200361 RepID=A0A453PDT6_AEGTS
RKVARRRRSEARAVARDVAGVLIRGSDSVHSGSADSARSKFSRWGVGWYGSEVGLGILRRRRDGEEIYYGGGDSASEGAHRWSSGDAADKQLLEEVNDNNSTMEPVRLPVVAPAEVELPAPEASSADGQICREEAPAEAGSADKGQSSEHSVEQLDPWTRKTCLVSSCGCHLPQASGSFHYRRRLSWAALHAYAGEKVNS